MKVITDKTISLIFVLFAVAMIFGYGRCIYKLCQCDFKPSYKAEIIYGIGTVSGLGVIIGYFNISDNQTNS